MRDRQRPGGDHFAGPGPDNCGAEDVALAVGDDLDVAIGRFRGQRPVVLAIGRAQHADGAGVSPGFVLQEADLSEFRVGMGHGRYGVLVEADLLAEQRVPHHELGVIGGEMGGFRPDGDVADRVDALVGGAQPLVDDDAVRVVADAGCIEIERFDIRPAPDGDKNMTAGDGLRPVRRFDIDLDARQHAAHPRDGDTDVQRDAFAFERVEHDGGAFGIVAGKRRRRFEHGDFGAEPPESLR